MTVKIQVGTEVRDATPEEIAALDLRNAEWQARQDAEAPARIRDELEATVQRWLDDRAAARGYGDAKTAPSVSARSYAGYPNQFQAECIAYGQWCAEVWSNCYMILAAVQAGQRPTPTAAELLAELPEMIWA